MLIPSHQNELAAPERDEKKIVNILQEAHSALTE
jgi:hypothetical protein